MKSDNPFIALALLLAWVVCIFAFAVYYPTHARGERAVDHEEIERYEACYKMTHPGCLPGVDVCTVAIPAVECLDPRLNYDALEVLENLPEASNTPSYWNGGIGEQPNTCPAQSHDYQCPISHPHTKWIITNGK